MMTHARSSKIRTTLATVAMAFLMACGGAATGPAPAGQVASTGLVYEDPKGNSWNLVRNASSTDTHLVLDLIGPMGAKGRGVGFNLQTDGSVAFARLGTAGYIADTGVFKLTSSFENYPVEPILLAGGLKKNGTMLTAGIFQKDRYRSAKAVDVPVCQIAIDFDPVKTASLAPGTAIPLTITKAKAIPAFIGTPPADPAAADANWSSVVANYSASLVSVEISVGTLRTK